MAKQTAKKQAKKPVKKTVAPKKATAKVSKSRKDHQFPIVGVGASAGGIEAISEFLMNLPDSLGMAYIVVQHLSNSEESLLPKILQQKTSMPVIQVKTGMHIEQNKVYVIPPGKYIRIVNHRFAVSPRNLFDKTIRTIDFFFTAMASTYRNEAIGVLLSGTGSDGTLGVQSIKTEGGITFAQNESAGFHGMVRSAYEAGYIDFILPIEKIVKELAAIVNHPYAALAPDEVVQADDQQLKKIQNILHARKGVDFASYKQTTITRRIMRRMALNKLNDLSEYIKLLNKSVNETEQLYRDLLINVTSFFREPGLYQAYTKKIFRTLFDKRTSTEPIRIWVPACATGEEACSIAISLFEYLGEEADSAMIQVFATDLSEIAIDKARTGIYTKTSLENVPPSILKRYFIKIDGSYQVAKMIRDVCIFATHNLMKDPPFSKMDMISCQNVLIYLDTNTQKKILRTFHYALKPAGYLVLGKSETVGNSNEIFEPADKEFKIYSKKMVGSRMHLDVSVRTPVNIKEGKENQPVKPNREYDIEKDVDRLLLSKYVPASVLVNKDMQILRFNGSTSNFLQPTAGKASLHLLKMLRDELVFDVRMLIQKAGKENRTVKKEGIQLKNNGASSEITLIVNPMRSSIPNERYYLIVFKEEVILPVTNKSTKSAPLTKPDNKDKRLSLTEEDLQEAREQMKTMSEEFEAMREELQSANEEILSSNEELQSINEELETSKEELQSTNEELTTINEELQNRNHDLKEAVDFNEAIIETIREPLVVLNNDLRIRSANKAFYEVFKLSTDNTEGYYLNELYNGDWNIPELQERLQLMVTKNQPFENVEVTKLFSRIGEKTLLISGMRMHEDSKRSRVLLAIADITQRKIAEQQLREREERFSLLVQNSFDVISILSKDGTIQYQSESIERISGYSPAETIGKSIFSEALMHPEDIEAQISIYKKSITRPEESHTSEFRLKHKNGTYRTIESVCINLLENARVNGIVANFRDVTERRLLERQKEEFIGVASHELRTPLTSIKSYTEILQDMTDDKNLDKEVSEVVYKLNKQTERLSNLVKDLLDITKISEGQFVIHPSELNINKLITEKTEEIQHTINGHEFVLQLNATKEIAGDEERIGQVITNLLSNAVKYSPAGGKIIVRSASTPNGISVSVEDFGIGMKEGTTDKVFEKFYRAEEENAKTFPGLGLGLFISATIVKKHHGTISVEAKKNNGCIFAFTLPFAGKTVTRKKL